MSKHRRKRKTFNVGKPKASAPKPSTKPPAEDAYQRAGRLAEEGRVDEARAAFTALQAGVTDTGTKAILCNDLGVLSAVDGDFEAAKAQFREALEYDRDCSIAQENLGLLPEREPFRLRLAVPPAPEPEEVSEGGTDGSNVRVAILSFLFNWPSTGGGIVHTVELAQFLARAGYDVRHFYARHEAWGVGKVEGNPPCPSVALDFGEADWNAESIRSRFRAAVQEFDPDHVVITDSWNIKPLLAEAVRGYPYILRFQAMECLCPLNNVRLLPGKDGGFAQCRLNQLDHSEACRTCLQTHERLSGGLHRAERALAGVGAPDYQERLLRAVREAEAVLVVNPLTAAILGPHNPNVKTVTAGMDPARFPWPPTVRSQTNGQPRAPKTILFAGLVEERMKGFHVLHEACSRLRRHRRDFELVATADPVGRVDEFTRFIGWQSQESLPAHMAAAEIVAVPTVAQDALGRTAVEAMAAGRPVVAARIGGMPFTVTEGVTGLLHEPGNPEDLAEKLDRLLGDPALCARMGEAGRRRFEADYSWPVIIERSYRPLLTPRRAQPTAAAANTPSTPAGASRPKRLSLVVAVLESYDVVRRQLLHLNGILTDDCELILVDDGSEPSLQSVCDSVVKSYAFRLHCTNDRRPWTQPRARNAGASLATADKLLFFDIDHILTSDIISRSLAYEKDKLHWVRRPGVLDENGRVVTDAAVLARHGLKDSTPGVHANSFLIRRPLFERLKGYDERFCGRYGGDDLDFNARYDDLVRQGIARRTEVAGEGFYYPDPAHDRELFHGLTRQVAPPPEPIVAGPA